MNKYKIQKIQSYLNRYGVKKLWRKARERKAWLEDYNSVRELEKATKEELDAERSHKFERQPVISIIMPAYNTPEDALLQTLESVKKQTYTRWQLCIADGGTNKISGIVEKFFSGDDRIRYISLEKNMGISDNSNEALKLATGDYAAFLDHDDILEPNALYEVVKKIVECNADMVYTDEDKVSEALDYYFKPYRKTDYNKMLLLSNNYICHFCVISQKIIEMTGGFRKEYDGAQDYDLFLRCIERAGRIEHVDKILYHWRTSTDSTSDNPFNKEYAFLAGKRAIEDYLDRNGLGYGSTVCEMDDPGYFYIDYTADESFKAAIVYKEDYESGADIIAQYGEDITHYLLLGHNMEVSEEWQHNLMGKAVLTQADIIVPKQIKKNKFVYGGISSCGKLKTPSMADCPKWYKGQFNLAVTDREVCQVPSNGILVTAQSLESVMKEKGEWLYNNEGFCNGMKMIYAPEEILIIR